MEGTFPSRASREAAGNVMPRWEMRSLITHSEGEVMAILYVGIDLAKNVFAIHGVDERGKAVLVRPSVHASGCIISWRRCLRVRSAGRRARRATGPSYSCRSAIPFP